MLCGCIVYELLDQQRYFHAVTSVALPLRPFSSIRHTPQLLRQFLMRSASAKLSSLLALFLSSSSSVIFCGVMRYIMLELPLQADSQSQESMGVFWGRGASSSLLALWPMLIFLTESSTILPCLRVKSAYSAQMEERSLSTREQALLQMSSSLALTQRWRLSLLSCWSGPSLQPDPFPLSRSFSSSLALSLEQFLFQLFMRMDSSRMRFMLHPLEPMILLATWNSLSFSIWISYLQVSLFCFPATALLSSLGQFCTASCLMRLLSNRFSQLRLLMKRCTSAETSGWMSLLWTQSRMTSRLPPRILVLRSILQEMQALMKELKKTQASVLSLVIMILFISPNFQNTRAMSCWSSSAFSRYPPACGQLKATEMRIMGRLYPSQSPSFLSLFCRWLTKVWLSSNFYILDW